MLKVCLVLALSSCGDDAPSAIDAPPGSADAAGTCSETVDRCAGETICMGGTCVAAYPRTYNFSNITVTASGTNDGAPWDPDSSLADITVSIENALVNIANTPVLTDRTMGEFPGPYSVMLTGDGALLILADDDDEGATEQIVACALVGRQEQLAPFRTHRVSCANGAKSMMMTVTPQ